MRNENRDENCAFIDMIYYLFVNFFQSYFELPYVRTKIESNFNFGQL